MEKFSISDIIVEQTRPNYIQVIGVGGGGGNAVNYMYEEGIHGVDFVICNTDAQSLDKSPIRDKIQLGEKTTFGLGAGADPALARQAAEESEEAIRALFTDRIHMVFVTAGMGGGTGTGAAPFVAKLAKEAGKLTVGVVTLPFIDEGYVRTEQAEAGILEMQKYVDSLLVINNQRLYELYGDMKVGEAFMKVNDVLCTAAKGIAEIITKSGQINVDFNDVKAVMKDSGVALLGNGRAKGENRIEEAIQNALNSPLLNHNNIHGATGVLVNLLWGTDDFTIREFNHITSALAQATGNCRHIFIGRGQDPELGDEISITVIATGFVANKDRHIAQHQHTTGGATASPEDYEQAEGEEELLDAPQVPKPDDTIPEIIEEPESGDVPLLLNTQIKLSVRREPAYKRGPVTPHNTPVYKEEEKSVPQAEPQVTKKDSMGRKYVNILQSIFN